MIAGGVKISSNVGLILTAPSIKSYECSTREDGKRKG